MGNAQQTYGICIYRGFDGFRFYNRLLSQIDDFDDPEFRLRQNSLLVEFTEKKFMQPEDMEVFESSKYKPASNKAWPFIRSKLAEVLEKKYNLGTKDLIVDIGSNDGTLLKGFKAKGMKVLGIEPTNAAKDANKDGITTFQSFFDRASVSKAKKKFVPPASLRPPMCLHILTMSQN